MKKLSFCVAILVLIALLAISCSSTPTTAPPVTTTPAANTTSAAATTPPKTSAATSPAASPAGGPEYGGTFRVIDPRSPTSAIGWFAEPGPPAGMWYYPMFEGLVNTTYDGVTQPLLAEAWQIAPDLKSVTFTLRQGVKFHDNSDFNAAVAKWNIDQFIEANMASVIAVDSVEVVDDYTIRVNLKEYNNIILSKLASIPMVSKAAFDAKGKEGLRWEPVGTGPFKFASFERDVSLKCTRFDNYWQEGKPYLDAVELYFIIDPLTASASFEAGEAEAVGGDNVKMLHDLQQKGYEIIKCYSGAVTLIPDSKNPDSPLANLKVRQAIDYAINRDAIVKARGFSMWTPTHQWAPPDSSAYITDLPARTYDPEKAKQLLAEAGYAGGLNIKIIGDSSTTDKEATVAVQGFLNKVGINAQLDWVDFAGFVQYVMGGWNNALLSCANGFNANLNSSTDFVWSQTAINFPSVLKSDTMQSLHQTSMASKEYDPSLVKKVNQQIFDEAMFLPLYCISRGHAVKDNVHDTGFYSLASWPMWLPADTWLSK